MLSCKQMKRALQNREPKIRTISCHRRIKHPSKAQATTPSSAYMWADVALLKLHCRPNDLDCWVESLDRSAGWLSISLPPLHVEGESVLWMSNIAGGQAQRLQPCMVNKALPSPNKQAHTSAKRNQLNRRFNRLKLWSKVQKHNDFPPWVKTAETAWSFKTFHTWFSLCLLVKKWRAANVGSLRDIPEFPLTVVAVSRFPEPRGSRD